MLCSAHSRVSNSPQRCFHSFCEDPVRSEWAIKNIYITASFVWKTQHHYFKRYITPVMSEKVSWYKEIGTEIGTEIRRYRKGKSGSRKSGHAPEKEKKKEQEKKRGWLGIIIFSAISTWVAAVNLQDLKPKPILKLLSATSTHQSSDGNWGMTPAISDLGTIFFPYTFSALGACCMGIAPQWHFGHNQ